MNFRDLKYLITVDKLNHFGKAAEECCVSQPTLSMQIKKLEEELNIVLFERSKKSVITTTAGLQIIEQAKIILQERQVLIDIARQHQDPNKETFRIGAFPTLAPFLFPAIIPDLNDDLPDMKLFLVEEKTENLIKQLKENHIDLALLAQPIEEDKFDYQRVFREPFYLAVSKAHHLAKKDKIYIEDLKEETHLLLEEGHCLSGQALEVCQWVGAQNFNQFRATSIETLRQMVASNLGITLIPELAAQTTHPNILYREIEAPTPLRSIALVWRKNSPFKETFEEIATIIKHATHPFLDH